jgi:AcrR family transcriptional regulator
MSRNKTDTQTRILDAAWNLLESSGGPAVRMGDIAKAAGISRQAVYLHFPTRAELLTATARHIDDAKGVNDRLAASRAATGGAERLDAFIEAWGNYIPEIHGVARALMAAADSDPAAAEAWADRMAALRQGCEAAVAALKKDGLLAPGLPPRQATDLLWTLLSVRNWEQLVADAGWPQKRYVTVMKTTARRSLTTVADTPT